MASRRVVTKVVSGDGFGRWVERLTVAACAGVIALIGVLYNNLAADYKEMESRLRAAETRQAVSDSGRGEDNRRLTAVENKLDAMNSKLDKLVAGQASNGSR